MTLISVSRPVWGLRGIATAFDAIGPTVYPNPAADRKVPPNMPVIALLCLNVAMALLLVVLGHGAGRRMQPTLAEVFLWSGVVLLMVPVIARISGPVVARGERLFLLLLLGEGLYLYAHLYSPTVFAGYDEYAHWVTASDILQRHKLFLENRLLPVSAFYPALEFIVTGFANLAGVDVFPAAIISVAVFRGILVVALFLFTEKITGSTRIAAITTVLYMSSSTFTLFHAAFSYESLGVVLVIFIMWSESSIDYENNFWVLLLPLAVLATLAITHHASSMAAALYLIVIVVMELLRRGSQAKRRKLAIIAALSFASILLWETFPFNPVNDYLSSAFTRQFMGLLRVFSGQAEAHRPFVVDATGYTQPIWVRYTAICGILFIALCLSTGFFRVATWALPQHGWWRVLAVLRGHWADSRVLLFALGALGYPVSLVFRLSAGWEIGDRMSTWVFISVGLVMSVAIIHYWETREWWRRWCTVSVISTTVLGGVVLSSGNSPIQGHFQVINDSASIEALGIETAKWTKQWLGPGNTFGANRINQLLLATFGDQNVVTNITTSMSRPTNVGFAYLEKEINNNALAALKRGRVDYMEVDLRDTTALPVLGAYIQPGEPGNGKRRPTPATLLKWDHDPKVSRLYDNGYIVIFNVGRLRLDDQS